MLITVINSATHLGLCCNKLYVSVGFDSFWTFCSFIMDALCNRAEHYIFALWFLLSFGSRQSNHYFRSVCLFVCADFFSAVFDPISIKLGHMLYVWV